MSRSEPITLSRDCEAIEIPSGVREILPAGPVVRIMQFLGSGYTVATIGATCSVSTPGMQMPWDSPVTRPHKRRGSGEPPAIRLSGIS